MKLKYIIPAILLLANQHIIQAQPDNKYSEVDALIKTKDMHDALTALNKLKAEYKSDTLNAEYWLRYAQASSNFSRNREAKIAIDRAIQLNPQNATYYFEKGLLLNQALEPDAAAEALEKAVQLQPNGEYYYWKGIMYQQLGNNKEAERDYTMALNKKFETAELYNNLSFLQFLDKKLDAAMASINNAIRLNDKYAAAYSARSKLHLGLLHVDSACTDKIKANDLGYQNTINIPDSVCTGTAAQKMRFATEVSVLSKLYEQAITGYSWLIDQKFIQSDFFLNRGYSYYQLKKFDLAEKDYLEALRLPNPATDLAYDNLSLLYFDMNKFEQSIEYATKRIEMNPQNHVPYIDRGIAYRKLKKYKEAEADFNQSLSIKPDFHRAFGYRGYMFLELEQYEKAYADARKSVEINREYGYGYLVLGQAKQKLKVNGYCDDLKLAKEYGEPDAVWVMDMLCK